MFSFNNYISGGDRTSIWHGIPIQHRNEVLRELKTEGIKVKIRYRGPRSHNTQRGRFNNRCSCLLADATTFAVYFRNS